MKKHLFNGLFVLTLLALITQTASARVDVPDASQTSFLLVIAFGGLSFIRRFFR